MPRTFVHRNEHSGSKIVGNTYAPVSERIAQTLHKHGVKVYDEKWVEWHYGLATDAPWAYFSVEVDGFVISSADDLRGFFGR